jgi:deazaflavin-dependent oxidoreductase (nitroreductase family)
MTTATTDRYLRPGFVTAHVVNPMMKGLTRLGVSMKGSQVLAVRGRRTGEWRTVPVNPLPLDGERYLVAPRGHTEWVRNIRAAGGGELRLGRKATAFTVTEVDDAAKPAIIRAYIAAWKSEVGVFFDGIDETSTDAELLAVAPGFPVFRLAGDPA